MYSGKSMNLGCCWYQTIAVVLLLVCGSAQAELILTSPPRENAAKGQQQYGPLAAALTELLGEKVSYQQPKGWLFYQRDMRQDDYDIVFDGPHFISWRILQFDHTPVAKLPGKLAFVVVSRKSDSSVKELDDLVNQPVCAIAPPNLSTLTILALYANPVRQPRLVSAKGGAPGVYKEFNKGECKAAILRDKFFDKKLTDEDRAQLKVLYRSQPISNQGITVSSRVTEEQRQKITEFLTHETPATMPILKRFAPKAKSMIPASKADYDEHYRLLTGVIFGWEITNPEYLRQQRASRSGAN